MQNNAPRLHKCLCLATLCAMIAGCPQPQKQVSSGFDSPEAVYEHFQSMNRTQDMQGLLDLYPPRSQPEVVYVFITYIGAQLGSKSPEARKELDAAIEKHGLTERFKSIPVTSFMDEKGVAERAQKFLKEVDIAALWSDVALIMTQRGNSPPKSDNEQPPTPLTDLSIKGESATAKSGDQTLTFVRVKGRWFLKWRAPGR